MTDLNISTDESAAQERRVPNHGQRCCLECGAAFTARRRASVYCTPKCRTDFLNRRNMRGAILYDLYMANRFEREDAQVAGVQSVMSRLAADWREEDNRKREGRRSWSDWRGWLRDRPYLSAERLVKRWTGRAALKAKQ